MCLESTALLNIRTIFNVASNSIIGNRQLLQLVLNGKILLQLDVTLNVKQKRLDSILGIWIAQRDTTALLLTNL